MSSDRRIFHDLHFSITFLTILPSAKTRDLYELERFGRHLCWSLPVISVVIASILSLTAIGLDRIWSSPSVTAAFYIAMDHFLHGLKRIDGLSDLGEGVFFRLARSNASQDEVWNVVRAPQNGPYGVALIGLFLLTQWALFESLLELGYMVFFFGSAMSAIFSKLGLLTAVAEPAAFRPESDFQVVAIGAARKRSLITGWVIDCGLCLILLWAMNPDFLVSHKFAASYVVIALALCSATAGWIARKAVIRAVRRLNGDVIGLAWCVSELVVLTVILLAYQLL